MQSISIAESADRRFLQYLWTALSDHLLVLIKQVYILIGLYLVAIKYMFDCTVMFCKRSRPGFYKTSHAEIDLNLKISNVNFSLCLTHSCLKEFCRRQHHFKFAKSAIF